MQAVVVSSNLHNAIKAIKSVEVNKLQELLGCSNFLKSLNLTGSEEKALVNILGKSERASVENYWV